MSVAVEAKLKDFGTAGDLFRLNGTKRVESVVSCEGSKNEFPGLNSQI